MLPMAAQGAAQAIEDGAALATLLAAMPGDVPGALQRYEAVRKPRATRLQELSAINRTRFHLPDGPEQQKRDELLVANGDRTFSAMKWLYEHDAGKGNLAGRRENARHSSTRPFVGYARAESGLQR
jgi:salicylate hydroxylase